MRFTAIASLLVLAGCSADLVNQSTTLDGFEAPTGIPWVESRAYHAFVYVLVPGSPDAKGNPTVADRLLKYDRYELGDKVNGQIIDKERRRYMTNYRAGSFSNAGFTLVLHPNQTLKEVKLTSTGKADAATTAAREVLGTLDEIEKKKHERLKREKEIRDLEEALQ